MSHVVLNQELLESLKREAKRKKREDSSLSYNQWLNALCSQYGYATFQSLKRRVEEIKQEKRDQELAEEDSQWAKRFEESLVWGSVAGKEQNDFDETFPLPAFDGDNVPWPNCFRGPGLFTCSDGPRRQLDGLLWRIDGPEMQFRGEELRLVDDQMILAVLIAVAGRFPCGRLVEFSADDLDQAAGRPLPEWGLPVQYDMIARSLWRFANSELTVNEFKFKGPILYYADARRQPRQFAIRFNPKFANFFHPILRLLG